MRFEYPKLLLLLLLIVPALGTFFWWSWREKRRVLDRFVNPRLLSQLMSGISPRLQRVRWYLLLGAAVLLVLALARPQWGYDWEEVRQRGLDIVVAIDTSRSMLAEDVQPNRLTRARLAALDLRKLAKADRMGLVAFAGTAFLQCPLSADDEAFRQSIDELNVNIIPQGGTALAEAIQTARMAFKDKTDNHKVLVLFTDGEDHDGHAVDAAREAAKDGMRIFTVGVGTRNGELLHVTDARGRSDYIKDPDGNVVKSRLDEGLLTQIAESTGGFYLLLGGARTIEALYETGLAPMPKSDKASRQIKRYHERFQWALLLAIVLLVAEMFVPERKRVARKAFAAAPALSKAAAVLVCCFLPAGLMAASASKALKDYGSRKFERALHQYEDLLAKAPNDARLNFNAGDAAFESGFYDKALKHFNSSLATEDLQLQERSFYNLGNAHYRIGEEEKEAPQKQANWEQAVTSYESALKLNPNDLDAKHNLEVVRKKLEELKQQQQQQNKDNKQNQEKSDDKEKKDQDKQQQQQQDQDQQKQSKSDQKKDDQKQQEQQKQEQQKREDQQQAQQQKPEQKDKSEQQQAQQKPGNEDKQEEQEPDQAGQQLTKIQMTPQQAVRLLESAKQEERTLVFIPPNKTNRNDRLLKDW